MTILCLWLPKRFCLSKPQFFYKIHRYWLQGALSSGLPLCLPVVNNVVGKRLWSKTKLMKETRGVTNENICHLRNTGQFYISSLVNRTKSSFSGHLWMPQCLDITLGRRLVASCASSYKDEGWWSRECSINNFQGH